MRLIALVHVWLRRSAGALAARSPACLHNAIFYSASVPVTAQRLRWEKHVHYSGVMGSKDMDQNMEQRQMLRTPRRSRFQGLRTEMALL